MNDKTYVRDGYKLGRNEPCFCGSGKKFKRCHGFVQKPISQSNTKLNFERKLSEIAKTELEKHKAREKQRIKQQGLGRSIISTEVKGTRFVAVGSQLMYGKWKTFPDFLQYYIKTVLNGDWGNSEIAKPFEDRHPVLQWYHKMCKLQEEHVKSRGEIFSTPLTGAISAYNRLAYNLYLIAHNGKDIQTELIRRLKINDGFQGAFFEAQVAAWLIKAGFELEFEDETDRNTTHCEFTATHIASGEKYSVEAKSRQINPDMNSRIKVGSSLHKALEKNAEHKRLIAIDLNRPLHSEDAATKAFDRAERIISQSENIEINGSPAPEAYVLVTNMNDQYMLDSDALATMASFVGFKKPDFMAKQYPSFREAARARERHQPMHDLFKSIETHRSIPTTFDGELFSEAFGDNKGARLIVGQTYLVPDADDKEVPATLTSATVMNGEAYCSYHDPVTNKNWLCKNELTEDEIRDYENHPDTFFGTNQPVSQKVDTPMDLFDFFVEAYKNTDKEKLVEILSANMNAHTLETLPQNELVEILAEGYTVGACNEGRFNQPKNE